jgi:hypothetical protein
MVRFFWINWIDLAKRDTGAILKVGKVGFKEVA